VTTKFAQLADALSRQWQSLGDRLGAIVRSPRITNGVVAERLQLLARKFDGLSLRERSIVFVGLVVVITMAWDSVSMQPLYRRERAARGQLDTVAPEGFEAEAALTDLDQLVESEKQLLTQYQRKRGELEQRAASLVDSANMTDVLTSLIASTRGVRLVRIANLPVEELKAPATGNEADTADTAQAQSALPDVGGVPAVAFVHGIELEVEGDYASISEYVRSIERQKWRFIWRKVELNASEYPKVNAKIVVATLGLERYWLTL
jgi:MSHA biogenesis protein MshJ